MLVTRQHQTHRGSWQIHLAQPVACAHVSEIEVQPEPSIPAVRDGLIHRQGLAGAVIVDAKGPYQSWNDAKTVLEVSRIRSEGRTGRAVQAYRHNVSMA
jgi:hypothetical protein